MCADSTDIVPLRPEGSRGLALAAGCFPAAIFFWGTSEQITFGWAADLAGLFRASLVLDSNHGFCVARSEARTRDI